MELSGRTVLITGGNSGIGRATADALAARGAAIILGARFEARARPVVDELRARHAGASIEVLAVDLASLASVRRAASALEDRPLDVLINNAGVAGFPGLTEDGFEPTIGTNYVGPFLLTKLLLPRLEAAPQGRVVNIASQAHARIRDFDWRWIERRSQPVTRSAFHEYAASKLMNILHARELARRLAGTRVTTYALHPGVIASNIWRALPWLVRRTFMLFMSSNEEGARTPVWCATAPELASSSGRYYEKCHEAQPTALARDDALAAALYERTEAALAALSSAHP